MDEQASEWRPLAHERLDLYRLARSLVTEVYRLTRQFPACERFGLVSQIRRAAVSIPLNVAEGAARGSKREFGRFLLMARGSMSELRVLLEISVDIGYTDLGSFDTLDKDLKRLFAMISGLIRHSASAAGKVRRVAPD